MHSILRAWTFWIGTHQRESYRVYLEMDRLKEVSDAPGNQRAVALFRDLGNDVTEVVVLSLWDSMDSIRAFIGHDLRKPKLHPLEDRDILIDREPTVHHFELTDAHAVAMLPPEWR